MTTLAATATAFVLVSCATDSAPGTGTTYFVIVRAADGREYQHTRTFRSDGGWRVNAEERARAERLAERVRAADCSPEHFASSPYWRVAVSYNYRGEVLRGTWTDVFDRALERAQVAA